MAYLLKGYCWVFSTWYGGSSLNKKKTQQNSPSINKNLNMAEYDYCMRGCYLNFTWSIVLLSTIKD